MSAADNMVCRKNGQDECHSLTKTCFEQASVTAGAEEAIQSGMQIYL